MSARFPHPTKALKEALQHKPTDPRDPERRTKPKESPEEEIFGEQPCQIGNWRPKRKLAVLVVREVLPVPCDRESWLVPQGSYSREYVAEAAALRLNYEAFSVLNKLDPGVSGAVSSMLTEHNTGVVSQVHELAPGPECEVVTVSFLPFFKIFWRLPIVFLVEELFVGNVFALRQESTDLFDGMAVNGEWLTHITTKRKCGSRPLAAVERAKGFLAFRIVSSRNSFRDHRW
jgi:hypothetical protein